MKKFLLGAAAIVALSAPAAAADLAARRYAPVVAPVYNWSGFYGGVNAGGAWGPTNWLYDVARTTTSHQVTGGFGGFQAGYNYQISSFVLGIEGDYSFANVNGSSPCPNPAYTCYSKVQEIADITGRIGFAWNRVLFYAKGGEAWAFNRYQGINPAIPNTNAGAETRAGWLGGVGLEYAYADCWTVKAEYNYIDFGTRTVTRHASNGSFAESIDVTQKLNVAKVGVNYKFGGPVLAKY
jgi:outer membrane immunogenic protein